MEEKIKVSDDIEKGSKLPTPIIMFLVVFTIVFLFFIWGFIKSGAIDVGVIFVFGFFFLIIFLFFYGIFISLKSNRSMKKHIEDGTIITKKVEITKFSYYYSSDDHGSEEGYYVVASDGLNEYESKLFGRARLTKGYLYESIDKDFCLKKGVPYSPKDPKYDKDFAVRKSKEIDEQINTLREQSKEMSFFAKIKNQFKIDKLYDEKNLLFPPSLICNGKNLYLGDEVIVLVDPDNPKNYEMKI